MHASDFIFGLLTGIAAHFVWSLVSTSPIAKHAVATEQKGQLINNEIMTLFHPTSYRSGHPQYLERDFEAGADFICREVMSTYGLDVCSSQGINWW